ncbi:MAG: acetolactate synthase small subunit [Prevotella sp.]|jgi:acetolactate synthase-1/3 small subunit|nr:acetolactate synthase small subunit [Prevotella sp.]MDY6241736.1 acetolactate synthase small subunit [Prevotella sp.]
MEDKFYTLLVYSENVAGILNEVTNVFTRIQVNIESLNVSASSIDGVHKYTITCWSNPEQIVKIKKQLEKKLNVIKANYYTDDQLFIHEVALYKISTPVLLDNPEVSHTIRKHDARMMEVNPTYSTVLLTGLTDDITDLYSRLNSFGCLLQYTRSGRIAVTRSTEEPVSEYLEQREK